MEKDTLVIKVANEYKRLREDYDDETYRDLLWEIPFMTQKQINSLEMETVKSILFEEDVKNLQLKKTEFLLKELKELNSL